MSNPNTSQIDGILPRVVGGFYLLWGAFGFLLSGLIYSLLGTTFGGALVVALVPSVPRFVVVMVLIYFFTTVSGFLLLVGSTYGIMLGILISSSWIIFELSQPFILVHSSPHVLPVILNSIILFYLLNVYSQVDQNIFQNQSYDGSESIYTDRGEVPTPTKDAVQLYSSVRTPTVGVAKRIIDIHIQSVYIGIGGFLLSMLLWIVLIEPILIFAEAVEYGGIFTVTRIVETAGFYVFSHVGILSYILSEPLSSSGTMMFTVSLLSAVVCGYFAMTYAVKRSKTDPISVGASCSFGYYLPILLGRLVDTFDVAGVFLLFILMAPFTLAPIMVASIVGSEASLQY